MDDDVVGHDDIAVVVNDALVVAAAVVDVVVEL